MHVGVTDLRANLSTYLERVQDGEEIVITEHGIPVARLTGIKHAALIKRLLADGTLLPPKSWERIPSSEIKTIKADGSISDLIRGPWPEDDE